MVETNDNQTKNKDIPIHSTEDSLSNPLQAYPTNAYAMSRKYHRYILILKQRINDQCVDAALHHVGGVWYAKSK